MEKRKQEANELLQKIYNESSSISSTLHTISSELEKVVQTVNQTSNQDLKSSKLLILLLKYQYKLVPHLCEFNDTLSDFLEEEKVLPQVSASSLRSYSRASSILDLNENVSSVDITRLKELVQQFNEKVQVNCPLVNKYVNDCYSKSETRFDNVTISRRPSISRHSTYNNEPSENGTITDCQRERVNSTSDYLINLEDEPAICSNRSVASNQVNKGDLDQFNDPSNETNYQLVNQINGAGAGAISHENGELNHTKGDMKEQINDLNPNKCDYGDRSHNALPDKNSNETLTESDRVIKDESIKENSNTESDPELIEVTSDPARSGSGSSSSSVSSSLKSSYDQSAINLLPTPTQSQNGTAMQKLSNFVVTDVREKTYEAIKPTVVPDISLKPLLNEDGSPVIKNANNYSHFSKNNTNGSNSNSSSSSGYDRRNSDKFEIDDFQTPSLEDECVFSYIKSPSEFYIHILNESSTSIDTISEQISKRYSGTQPPYKKKANAMASLGKYCVAYNKTFERWYRAEVIDWFMEGDEVKCHQVLVEYVDFGDRQRIRFTNLRKISDELRHIPRLAVKCRLPLVYPPESTPNRLLTKWPDCTINTMQTLAEGGEDDGNFHLFKIVYCVRQGDIVDIDLYSLRMGNEEATVGQMLLDMNLAVQIIDAWAEGEDPNLATYLGDANDLGAADDILVAVQGCHSKDEARICRFSRFGKKCYKGARCPFEHIDTSKEAFTTDTVQTFWKANNIPHIPEEGSKVKILVTGFISVCQFYAQLIYEPFFVNNRTMDRRLYGLMDVMNGEQVIRNYKPLKVLPAVGEMVVVKHWAMKKWLRARVVHIVETKDDNPQYVNVFFVDFGEKFQIHYKEIKQIKEDFLHLPFQATRCHLEDVEPNPCAEIMMKANQFFYSNISFRNFEATILSNSIPLKIAVKTKKGGDLREALLHLNFIRHKKIELLSLENFYIHLE